MTKAKNTVGKNAKVSTRVAGSKYTFEIDGLVQTSFLMAAVVNEDLPNNLNQFHARQLGIISQRAERIFEEQVTRPNESGRREGMRETGKFLFGRRSGGAFKGVSLNDESANVYGFGYPDVQHADTTTHFVWRSLEFGLRPHPRAIQHEFGPRGHGKFPRRFTFIPFTGKQGYLSPRGGPAGPVGTLITPRGQIVKKVAHPGIAPRQFITRAFEQTAQNMPQGYSEVIGRTYKDFR